MTKSLLKTTKMPALDTPVDTMTKTTTITATAKAMAEMIMARTASTMRSTLLEERRWERGENERVDADLIVIDTRRRGETNSANCCVCVFI